MCLYSALLAFVMSIDKVVVISGGSFSSLCFMSVSVPLNLCICAGVASSFSLLTSALISTERSPGSHVSLGSAQLKRICSIRMDVLKCPSLLRCHVLEYDSSVRAGVVRDIP